MRPRCVWNNPIRHVLWLLFVFLTTVEKILQKLQTFQSLSICEALASKTDTLKGKMMDALLRFFESLRFLQT